MKYEIIGEFSVHDDYQYIIHDHTFYFMVCVYIYFV